MAKFIIAEIINSDKECVGYRILDSETSNIDDLSLEEALKAAAGSDSFAGFAEGIANADANGSKIKVKGFDKKPSRIDRVGEHVEGATHIVCGFNPIFKKVLMADYCGNLEKMDLSDAKKKAKVIGFENLCNADIFEMIEESERKEEANKPKCVYIGEDKKMEIPAGYEENVLVNQLYTAVNATLNDIIGAYIIHTNMKMKGKVLKYNDNGEPIATDNYLDFDVNDTLAESFVILETNAKRFITVPVCQAFKPLIEKFECKDSPIEKFKDLLDFLADENDDLELDDEHTISKIIGGDIVSVILDNTESVAIQIDGGQPIMDYETMDMTFIVNVREKKKNIELVVSRFPWILS